MNAAQIEKLLVDIWSELLDIDVRAEENVFDIGAYSLLVVDVVARMREAGVQIRAMDVFDHPAPAELAAHLGAAGEAPALDKLVAEVWRNSVDPADPRAPRALLPLIADGTREPLFCVPMGTGHAEFFTPIAEKIRQGRPVYAFQTPGRTADVRPFLSVRDMAAHYLRELREFQPHGPYHLAGFCSGALTVIEMARTLRESGEQVPTLVLAGPSADFPELNPGWGLTELTEYLLGSVRQKLDLDPATQLDAVVRRVRDLVWFEADLPAADFYRRVVLWAGDLFAQEHHNPGRYDGPAVVCMYGNRDIGAYWRQRLPAARIIQSTEITTFDMLSDPLLAAEFLELLA